MILAGHPQRPGLVDSLGHLKEEIYMRQPTGFDDGTGRVCRLLRTLYGLKQSGREWNNRLNDYLVHKLGYTRFDNIDHCIYLRQRGDTFDFIAVWVDDLLFVCSSSNSLHIAKTEISSEFEATDQGDPRLTGQLKCYITLFFCWITVIS